MKTMIIAFALLLCGNATAQETLVEKTSDTLLGARQEPKTARDTIEPADFFGAEIGNNQPIYGVWVWPWEEKGDGVHLNDKPHAQFHLSPRIRWKFGHMRRYSIFAAYNGRYDFYVGGITSGPIISRLQNPELMFTWDFTKNPEESRLKLGFAHESNGMFVERRGQMDSMSLVFDSTFRPHDFASMGWNYFLAQYKHAFDFGGWEIGVYATFKYFVKQDYTPLNWFLFDFDPKRDELEDRIFWRSDLTHATIKEYDGTRLLVTIKPPEKRILGFHEFQLSLLYQTGEFFGAWNYGEDRLDFTNYFDKEKHRVEFGFSFFDVPWVVFYEGGRGKDLATYPFRTASIGTGIKLHDRMKKCERKCKED